MTRSLAAVGGLVAALVLSRGAAAAEPAGAEASLRAASANEVRDFLAADTRGLAGLWADTLVVTNPLNQLVDKPRVLKLVSSGVLRFTSYERTLEYVHAYGDVAVVAGAETVRWAGTMPLAGKTSHLRYTAVWRRSGGKWLEVARHANVVPARGTP
jgi:hypothetical protein